MSIVLTRRIIATSGYVEHRRQSAHGYAPLCYVPSNGLVLFPLSLDRGMRQRRIAGTMRLERREAVEDSDIHRLQPSWGHSLRERTALICRQVYQDISQATTGLETSWNRLPCWPRPGSAAAVARSLPTLLQVQPHTPGFCMPLHDTVWTLLWPSRCLLPCFADCEWIRYRHTQLKIGPADLAKPPIGERAPLRERRRPRTASFCSCLPALNAIARLDLTPCPPRTTCLYKPSWTPRSSVHLTYNPNTLADLSPPVKILNYYQSTPLPPQWTSSRDSPRRPCTPAATSRHLLPLATRAAVEGRTTSTRVIRSTSSVSSHQPLTLLATGVDAAEKKFGVHMSREQNEEYTDKARDMYEKEVSQHSRCGCLLPTYMASLLA